jgi:clan AA aspartic protease
VIQGTVTDEGEAMLHLVVLADQGQALQAEVVIDTGYTGTLTLPLDLISKLRLPLSGKSRGVLADGREITYETYDGTVIWHGQQLEIRIDAVNSDPLLGMGLLYGSKLTIEVVEGGEVVIRELPLS